jgi:hypothetical protein
VTFAYVCMLMSSRMRHRNCVHAVRTARRPPTHKGVVGAFILFVDDAHNVADANAHAVDADSIVDEHGARRVCVHFAWCERMLEGGRATTATGSRRFLSSALVSACAKSYLFRFVLAVLRLTWLLVTHAHRHFASAEHFFRRFLVLFCQFQSVL